MVHLSKGLKLPMCDPKAHMAHIQITGYSIKLLKTHIKILDVAGKRAVGDYSDIKNLV